MRRLEWMVATALLPLLGCGGGETPPPPTCDEARPNKVFYRDADTDGFGDPADELARCSPPAGYVDNDLDCDDTDERVHPNTAWHPDVDGDGFGDAHTAVTQCVRPADHILDGSDCDDADAMLGPTTPWYADQDGDGFGDAGDVKASCEKPAGYVRDATDCDDGAAQVNPDSVWHQDADGDGFGAPSVTLVQCETPSGYVLQGDDCDDGDPLVNPDTQWFLDADNDGWGGSTMTVTGCVGPANHVLQSGDCDDGDKLVYPGLGQCPHDTGGKSCKDILQKGLSKGDGAYLIDPDGPSGAPPFAAWCDMTTDGGGWTALINPSNKQMPTSTIPGLSFAGALLSGSDTCTGNPSVTSAFGWFGIQWLRCGDLTIQTTLSWANDIGAKDMMFTATLMGQTTATITADGVDLPEDAVGIDALGGRCEFHNAASASVVPPIATCWSTLLDAAPAVHHDAFAGPLTLALTTGPGCSPTCQYGTGHTIQKLFVR